MFKAICDAYEASEYSKDVTEKIEAANKHDDFIEVNLSLIARLRLVSQTLNVVFGAVANIVNDDRVYNLYSKIRCFSFCGGQYEETAFADQSP